MRATIPASTRGEAALAWLGLGLVVELEPREALALVARFGSPAAVCDAPQAALIAAGAKPAAAAAIPHARRRAAQELEALARTDATFVCWEEDSYPARLREIADPPLSLAVRGTLTDADTLAVAVVGARRASEYGRGIAAEIAGGLARVGVTVVSGLAAGIDAAAHRAALGADGRTLAVLGTGIDRVYPPWHAGLAQEIVRGGALISEFPCGTPPLPYHFPRRNRLISGLTLGTIVVEAAEQSGSLITARWALEQGREVFAVPGPAGLAAHRGPHRLIQEGAKLVTRVEDVLEELAPALVARLAERRAAAEAATLSSAERRILEAVGAEGCHVDHVIQRTAVAAAAVLETLLALELRGLVQQLPGKRFRRLAA